jgi:hypothetical protein
MKLSAGAINLRAFMEKAIADHKISKAEYDRIIHLAAEDEHIDQQELVLLRELQEMIANKTVKLVP